MHASPSAAPNPRLSASDGEEASGRPRFISWLLGAAVLGAVVAAAIHYSDEREFVNLAERVSPLCLLLAAVLQAGTYGAQGQIWRSIARAERVSLPPGSFASPSCSSIRRCLLLGGHPNPHSVSSSVAETLPSRS